MTERTSPIARPAAKQGRKFGLRTWATPVTIGSSLLMAVSGVLMFFDVVPGYLVFAHEWFSWIFLAGIGGHIAANLKPLAKHLQSNWGRGSVVVFGLLLVASTYSFGLITAPQLKWPISQALIAAPLSALADVTQTAPSTLVEGLAAHGIAASPGDSIEKLAAAHDMDEFHILGLIFLRK